MYLAWMGVTNLENNQNNTHVKQIAEFAVDIINESAKIMIDLDDPLRGFVSLRVGFHSGSVVSNVIGTLNKRYGLAAINCDNVSWSCLTLPTLLFVVFH